MVTQDVNTLTGYHKRLVLSGQTAAGVIVLRRGLPPAYLAEELVLCCYDTTLPEIASTCVYLPFADVTDTV